MLVHGVAVHFDKEVEHVEEALDVLDLDEGEQVPPDIMMIEGVLIRRPGGAL